jgi:hypothetical protein
MIHAWAVTGVDFEAGPVISRHQNLTHRELRDRPGASRATVSMCRAHRLVLDHSLLAVLDEKAPAPVAALCQKLSNYFVARAVSGPDVPAGCVQ